MAKADFLTALAIIALGLGALVESYRMPRFEQLGANPYTVPGIVPGLIGAVIAGLGAILLIRAWRHGGWRLGGGGDLATGAAARRLYLCLLLTLGYAAGLVGTLPFWLATGLFVFLFIALFEWPAGETGGGRPRRIAIAALLAVAVTVAVTAIFQYLFLVRLP
jgi:hypothetical protein